MKIKILRKNENELEMEIEGEGHTFCNLLRKTLYQDKSVKFAAYRIIHPLINKVIFYVKTDGSKGPIQALIDAANRIIKDCDELEQSFRKELQGK